MQPMSRLRSGGSAGSEDDGMIQLAPRRARRAEGLEQNGEPDRVD
jgi:hypothetical protein